MTIPYVTKSGDLILDTNGKMYLISGQEENTQRMKLLFNTQLGSDLLFPEYGFDKESVIRAGNTAPFIFRMACINALNPTKLYDIVSVNNIQTYMTGTTGLCSFDIEDKDGNYYSKTIEVKS